MVRLNCGKWRQSFDFMIMFLHTVSEVGIMFLYTVSEVGIMFLHTVSEVGIMLLHTVSEVGIMFLYTVSEVGILFLHTVPEVGIACFFSISLLAKCKLSSWPPASGGKDKQQKETVHSRMVWNYTFCWITICGSQR